MSTTVVFVLDLARFIDVAFHQRTQHFDVGIAGVVTIVKTVFRNRRQLDEVDAAAALTNGHNVLRVERHGETVMRTKVR